MSIYKSAEGKQKILALYDSQLHRLQQDWSDMWIDTKFGRTHLIRTGNPHDIPLLVFHGGNATTAYMLLTCDYLMDDYLIYAVDTIGHPGKSAEVSLSPLTMIMANGQARSYQNSDIGLYDVSAVRSVLESLPKRCVYAPIKLKEPFCIYHPESTMRPLSAISG